jgi:hypothetical protein
MKLNLTALSALIFIVTSCKKEDNTTSISTANINFIFKFDSTQVRLNAIGQPSVIPAGNAAQSPRFNKMSAHYLELTPNALTALGGAVKCCTMRQKLLSAVQKQ